MQDMSCIETNRLTLTVLLSAVDEIIAYKLRTVVSSPNDEDIFFTA